MIRLNKRDLIEFGQVTVLANTPLSLYKGMMRCSGTEKLRKWSTGELLNYYDRITARPERDEIVVALAYAVLCAIILRTREEPGITCDPSHLSWGPRIWDFAMKATIGTGRIDVQMPSNRPRILQSTSPPADFRLLGPDGRPMIR